MSTTDQATLGPPDSSIVGNTLERGDGIGPLGERVNHLYWRKRMQVPENIDPHRDRCGNSWVCPAVPLTPEHVTRALEHMVRIPEKHGFEAQVALILPSERQAYMFPAITYDRDVMGDDEKAQRWHDELIEALCRDGYYPYRLGIQSMGAVERPHDTVGWLLKSIKELVDPDGILAPGR